MINKPAPEIQLPPEEETQLTPEMAKSLTKAGRVPVTELAVRGFGIEAKDGIIFHIPPEGTKSEDHGQRRVGGAYMFPGGVAKSEWLPIAEGRKVRRAIEDTLRIEGKDTSSDLSYLARRIGRWFKETNANEF